MGKVASYIAPAALGVPTTSKRGTLTKEKYRPLAAALANAQAGSHQPRPDLEAGSGSKSFFVPFSHFSILHEILSILSTNI